MARGLARKMAEKNTENVFPSFDSGYTGMTRHKLYVLWEINVNSYY